MFKLAKYLKKYRKEVVLGPLFKLIEAVFELIVPMVMARIIDVGIPAGDTGYILRMGGVMLLLGLTGLCFSLTCQFFAARASQGFGTTVRNAMFAHINSLSHREIDRFGTPSLITRVTGDVNQLQVAVAMLIRLATRAPFLVIGATAMAFLLDAKLALIFLVTAPVIALALYLVMSRSIPHYRRIQKKLDKISLITRENLEGTRVIRAFSKQEAEERRFNEAAGSLTDTSLRVGRIAALLNPATSVIINCAIIAIVWFGGVRVDGGALTQGAIIAFVNYMMQILLALIVIADLVVLFTKASASASRVNEVLSTVSSVTDEGNETVTPVPGAPKVEFRGVALSYNEGADLALERVDLTVSPGETVGIIGGTGSGKSTLVNLIPRFYDATAGEVLIDGVNVARYPLEQLRSAIGVVPQRAELFTGTIAENLRWGKKDAPLERLKAAARTAQAADFVEALPDGYDTAVQAGGKNFSGGQKQRLTIARALVPEPDILILDDSASALDFATDARLRQALRRDTAGMTVFLVSQRAATVKNADKIVVLDEGKVAGIGTHAELFASNEVYREICLSQLTDEEAAQ